jgi:hypothetical protein
VAGTQLRINGLDELRKALLALPPELVRESAAIVHAHAAEAERQIAAAYPVVTGNLRDHLRVELRGDTVSASAIIRNTAVTRSGVRRPFAWIYERGTGPRRWARGKGTGMMPKGDVFIPIAMRRRQIMVAALIDLVERTCLHVTGTSV